MNLVVEYEEIDGIKCMTIVDTETDTAMASWNGEDLEKLLKYLVNKFVEELKEE